MRHLISGAVVASLIAVAAPVAANHINEPTQPISGIEWRVYPYPNGQAQACGPLVDAGATPYVFAPGENIRFELDAVNLSVNPSEHFNGRLNFISVLATGQQVRHWDILDRHWNIPPHAFARFEVWQNNAYGLAAGTYVLEAQVDGLETGDRHLASCQFVVAEPGSGGGD
ncbi:MAG: hypothetical protein GWO24_05050, partial [Akkermansiaceae bacterium]|nr:hypothetical protein [Akkermansiaceae bacterium]